MNTTTKQTTSPKPRKTAQQKRRARIDELRNYLATAKGPDKFNMGAQRAQRELAELQAREERSNRQRVLSYTPRMSGRNYDGEKTRGQTWHVIVHSRSKYDRGVQAGLRPLVEVRVWEAARNPTAAYATIWIRADGRDGAGFGSTSGHGYHRASAAIDAAITSAGIRLAKPIDGCGDSATEEALRAIAAHLGYRRCMVVRP